MPSRLASGAIMVLLGVWLLMQVLAGDLARRLISWGDPPRATGAGTPPADPDGRNGGGFSSGGGGGGGGGGYGAN